MVRHKSALIASAAVQVWYVYDNGAAQVTRVTLLRADGSVVDFAELGPMPPTGEPYRP